MKCYNHHDRDAFGTCQACGKALCLECIDASGNIVKCKNNPACKDRSKLINISYSNIGSTYSKSHKVMSVILGFLFFAPGLAGTIVSLLMRDVFTLVISLIFMALGFAILNSARKLQVK